MRPTQQSSDTHHSSPINDLGSARAWTVARLARSKAARRRSRIFGLGSWTRRTRQRAAAGERRGALGHQRRRRAVMGALRGQWSVTVSVWSIPRVRKDVCGSVRVGVRVGVSGCSPRSSSVGVSPTLIMYPNERGDYAVKGTRGAEKQQARQKRVQRLVVRVLVVNERYGYRAAGVSARGERTGTGLYRVMDRWDGYGVWKR